MKVKNAMGEMVETTELKDLDVERIDGVDRPATGRRFLLMKSAERAKELLASGVRKSAVSFASVLFGAQTNRVEKSVREWVPGQGELQPTKVAAALDAMNAETTDVTKTPDYSRSTSGFEKPTPTGRVSRVMDGYVIHDPWLYPERQADPGFSAGEGSDLVRPSDFRATNPGALSNDGVVAQISKSELEWAFIEARETGDVDLMDACVRKAKENGFNVRKSVDITWPLGRMTRLKKA